MFLVITWSTRIDLVCVVGICELCVFALSCAFIECFCITVPCGFHVGDVCTSQATVPQTVHKIRQVPWRHIILHSDAVCVVRVCVLRVITLCLQHFVYWNDLCSRTAWGSGGILQSESSKSSFVCIHTAKAVRLFWACFLIVLMLLHSARWTIEFRKWSWWTSISVDWPFSCHDWIYSCISTLACTLDWIYHIESISTLDWIYSCISTSRKHVISIAFSDLSERKGWMDVISLILSIFPFWIEALVNVTSCSSSLFLIMWYIYRFTSPTFCILLINFQNITMEMSVRASFCSNSSILCTRWRWNSFLSNLSILGCTQFFCLRGLDCFERSVDSNPGSLDFESWRLSLCDSLSHIQWWPYWLTESLYRLRLAKPHDWGWFSGSKVKKYFSCDLQGARNGLFSK